MPLIEARQIGHTYDGVNPILKNVSFTLERGQCLGIIGPNGGGKSTLLKIIVGAQKPTSGELLVQGQDAFQGPFPHHLFSYVPQHTEIDSTLPLKVKDMVRFGSLGRAEQLRPLEEVLKLVGLSDKADYRFATLSGGERQRALLARALLSKTSVLALDEPTTGLDSNGQDQLLGVLRETRQRLNMAVIMVGHDIPQMLGSCDRILCLNRTHHWHDKKEMLTPKVLESIYHCEFEHLMIHLDEGPKEKAAADAHHACAHDHAHESGNTHHKKGDE